MRTALRRKIVESAFDAGPTEAKTNSDPLRKVAWAHPNATKVGHGVAKTSAYYPCFNNILKSGSKRGHPLQGL